MTWLGPVRVRFVLLSFFGLLAAVAMTHAGLYQGLVLPRLDAGAPISVMVWLLVVAPVLLMAIGLGFPVAGGAELIACALAGELARSVYVAWAAAAGLRPFAQRAPGLALDEILVGAACLLLLMELGALLGDGLRRS